MRFPPPDDRHAHTSPSPSSSPRPIPSGPTPQTSHRPVDRRGAPYCKRTGLRTVRPKRDWQPRRSRSRRPRNAGSPRPHRRERQCCPHRRSDARSDRSRRIPPFGTVPDRSPPRRGRRMPGRWRQAMQRR
uniref:Uncharacterized protein n=1 Tax=Paracoccus marcusii TaxID=59779 RepID=J7K7S5_9RHOB|nr:hypothetical protein [Paracoccus marcusii]